MDLLYMTAIPGPPSDDLFTKLTIKNDLLYELMTKGHGLSEKYGFIGWPSINGGGVGTYGLLTWLTARSLGVDRFPWYPEQRLTLTPGSETEAVQRVLTAFKTNPQFLEEVTLELQQIYRHTQSQFAQMGLSTVRLVRSFSDGADYEKTVHHNGFASRLVTLQRAARQLGYESFDIPFRTLSSWAKGGYGNSTVDVALDIPVEDIVWGNATIESRVFEANAIESDEWVVLNRRKDGVVSIPVEAITRNIIDPITIRAFSNDAALQYLDEQRTKMDSALSKDTPGSYNALRKMTFPFRLRRAFQLIVRGD
ncbi:hypothetical protein PU99_13175 [Pseudomonas putida]|nr:hypothetical protein PU99_13175 [Pseudomonas putida]